MVPSKQLDNYIKLLTCPVEFTPLHSAVNLTPCCHKVNQAAAQTMYGNITPTGLCELRKKCVICNVIVSSYAPDHTIRELALLTFDKDPLDLPSHPAVIEFKKESESGNLPYPGEPAVFVHKDGDWNDILDTGNNKYRDVELGSKIPDSLMQNIRLFGYRSGEIMLTVEFKDSPIAQQYFISHGLFPDDIMTCKIYARTIEQIKKLFKIIAENNQMPEDQFALWKSVIEKGGTDFLPQFYFEDNF